MNTVHAWKFYRVGGVDQVVLRNGADLANLDQLDQKLWMALGMPTRGVEFDARTADLLDTDKDGQIRPPEILAAIAWAKDVFQDLNSLVQGGDMVPLAAIKKPEVLASAKRILSSLGKPAATRISLEDVSAQEQMFANTKLNGDGVIPAEAAEDEATRQAITEIIHVMGAIPDLSGKPGLNQANLDAFFAQAEALSAWAQKGDNEKSLCPLGLDGTAAAAMAIQAVKGKVDDYFVRCRLAAFDARAASALNREESAFLSMAAQDLSLTAQEISGLPLALIEAHRPLPLDNTVNPAWADAIATLQKDAVEPLLGADKKALTAADWSALQAKLAPYADWQKEKPSTVAETLGLRRLREMLASKTQAIIAGLIAQDLALAAEFSCMSEVEKMVRFQRDLFKLLTNFVNFADFYGKNNALFQAGTLYLDARACHLCIDVADPAKHGALAGLSGAFLAYCDLSRPGGQKRTIAAVFSNGDSDNLMVGRNGVFYDRQGRDWNATITKIINNPISVREAFWLPYKKLIRFIEEQVAKRAQTAEEASITRMAGTAETVVAAPTAPPPSPKKMDLGTIALIGTAVGGISALVGGFLQSIFGLGMWLPLGVAGVILLISGPSMVLAWLKLRQRNLGPLLDANGWAINTRAILNVAFGAALTEMAALPPGADRSLLDPYAAKAPPWKLYLALAVVLVLCGLWWTGKMDRILPGPAQKAAHTELFKCK